MRSINTKNVLWHFTKRLSNLNFSLFLLLLITLLSILGSIIEQDQNLSFYQTQYPDHLIGFTDFNWRLILFLGLDHLYQTWWFVCLLIVFSLSLVTCTFSIQLPSLKNARRWKFTNDIKTSHVSDNFKFIETINSSINIVYALNYHNFYSFHKKNCIYAYKGLIGRIAPIFVHFSIILTLCGSLLSLFFGCTVQEMIPVGESFHLKNIIRSGIYSNLSTNLVVHIDDFTIDYNLNDSSIRQFFSTLSLFDNSGKQIVHETISVNHPLLFSSITFYQTDWQMNAVRFSIGYNSKFIVQKKLRKIEINGKTCWICNLPTKFKSQLFCIIFNLKDPILICDSAGIIINTIFPGDKIYIDNALLVIKSIIIETGLQIKVDPGIYLIYLGFFLLMLSTVISYISYSQIWVNIQPSSFRIAGSTNRAILFFEEDIYKIHNKYTTYTCMNYKDDD